MKELSIGFIGFGLIGGSIARALKKKNEATKIYAYNARNPEKNPSLELALKEHNIDQIEIYLDGNFCDCDIIFLCAPVLSNIAYLAKLKDMIKPTCILTDVGSVKGNIHEAVTSLQLEGNFIGGHPMAGSEKTGYINSSAHLLENAYYLLTPTPQTPKEMVTILHDLVCEVGAIPVVLDEKNHDDITAAISHVPHIIASTLVNMIKDNDDDQSRMHTFAAGGFKDITRIASSSPEIWQNICLTNSQSITKFINIFCDSLKDITTALEKEDKEGLFRTFETAREYRNSIPNKSVGMISKLFEVYADIADETGAIATIATILASNSISIKNIGIIHNREFEQGVLRIELYDDESSTKTLTILKQHSYKVYER